MTTAQEIVDRFPAFAAILGVPEIADLIQQASGQGNNWSSAYFREQLWGTHWWKTTPETARTWQMLKLNDPATAGEQSRSVAANVVGIASSLGINLRPEEVALYAEGAAAYGWDDKALTRKLIDQTARDRYQSGAVQATVDSLRATASSYAMPLGDHSLMSWAQKIHAGRATTDGFEQYARTHARVAFPTLQKELEAGLTVKQLADPYLQMAGQTLGVNPDTLDLMNPKWQRALQSRDAKGTITGPMTNLDWQRTLMTDKAYGYDHSANGKTAALQMKDDLSKTFGLTA